MSPIPLGILASVGGLPEYWLGLITGPTGVTRDNRIAALTIDSSGSIIGVGQTNSYSPGDYLTGLIYKMSKTGEFSFKSAFSSNPNPLFSTDIRGVTRDSSNNIFTAGFRDGGDSSAAAFISRHNSSGALVWHRWVNANFEGTSGKEIAVNSSIGVMAGSAQGAAFVAIFNLSTGAITSTLNNTLYNGYETATLRTDSAGNFIFNSIYFVEKRNSSFGFVWRRSLTGGGGSDGMCLDSSDNIFMVGQASSGGAGGLDMCIKKINSSGTWQWDRLLGGAGYDQALAAATDSLGDLYVVGQSQTSPIGTMDLILAKYNTSGTLLFQRRLGASGASIVGRSLQIDPEGAIVIGGTASGTGYSHGFTARLKSDGTGTGTYAVGPLTMTYQASSLISANRSTAANAQSDIFSTRGNNNGSPSPVTYASTLQLQQQGVA